MSELVYSVAVSFKMTEQAEQQICIRFCVNLEHSPHRNYSDDSEGRSYATGDGQLPHNNMPTPTSHLVQGFFVKHLITQVTQAPYSPDLSPYHFWLFSKLKAPLKGKRFQIVDEIQENMMGQLMSIGRTV